MSRTVTLPIPVKKAMWKLGKDINNARRRRRVTMELMAERAGISRITLAKIEKGQSSVSIGAYASALFVLGMTSRLENLADSEHDLVGRELEEENLPKRIRLPRSSRGKHNEEP
ncbi:MAG: hypothetical protein COA94_09245 [Rickettsiales bacterium]|nr:MAG: hypothetical protein COA94_09245 [Rickettsiales bacterium]